MTDETLKTYAPCTSHRLWHDLETTCFHCLVEEADKAPLPELEPLIAAKAKENLKTSTGGSNPRPLPKLTKADTDQKSGQGKEPPTPAPQKPLSGVLRVSGYL